MLLRYLKGTVDLSLHFGRFHVVLEGYCDANWVSGNDETCSTSGYVFTMGGGAISWKSSKQTCIAHSTIESEFIALELANQEVEWLRDLLADVSIWGDSKYWSFYTVLHKLLLLLLKIVYIMQRRDT